MDRDERDLILDLFGELPEEERARFQSALEGRADLRDRWERYRSLLHRYHAEEIESAPELDLSSLGASRDVGWSTATWWLRFAAGIVALVGAFLAGRVTGPTGSRLPTASLDRPAAEVSGARTPRQHGSAQRIAWIEQSVRSSSHDPAVAEVVRLALRQDPSVNVRLAAVDALFATPELAPSAPDLDRILAREPSVALRLALVDWMAAASPAGWLETLRAVERRDQDPTVRSRARLYGESRS
jgi:hypothetical protein